MSLSAATANALVNFVFRGQSFALGTDTATRDGPPALFVGLMSSTTAELTGTSYARVEVPCTTAAWAAPSGGATSNVDPVTFPAPGSSWGSATHLGLYAAASGGSPLLVGALSSPMTINSGDAAPVFAAGEVVATMG